MVFARVLAVLVLSLALVSAVELGYVGIDAFGGDLTTVYNIPTALACAQACDNNANCRAWVWSYPGSGCATANACYLKGPSAATAIAARSNCACCELGYATGQAGVDRSGGDLPGMPIVFAQTSSSTCANACKNTAGCVAWAFDSCGRQNCWLKSSVTGTSSNGCRVSGVQGSVNMDIYGADLPNGLAVLSAYATATDCSALCSTTPGCNSWSFVTPGVGCETQNNCWMKSASPAVGSGTANGCRTSLSQPGISPPPGPTAAPTRAPPGPTPAPTPAPTKTPGSLCNSSNICHYNNCPFTLNLWKVTNGGAAAQACTLTRGKSCGTPVPSGWGGNFKHNSNGLSLAEFQINGWNNLDYYDISYIVGFDYGMVIESSRGNPTCKTLACPQNACLDAYHLPDDVQTHTCATGSQFKVTWCP